MPERAQDPGVGGQRADRGQGVRQGGPEAEPAFRRLAEVGEEAPGGRRQGLGAGRAGRSVEPRELHRAGRAEPPFHRGDEEPALDRRDRLAQQGVRPRKPDVVSPFGVEGDALREPPEEALRPRAGRDHHPVRDDAFARGHHLDHSRQGVSDPPHLGVPQAPAPLHKRPREPVHDRMGVAEMEHVLEVDPAMHDVGEGRLQRADLAPVEFPEGDPVGAPPLAVPAVAAPALLRFVDVESAGGPEQRPEPRPAGEGKEAVLRPREDPRERPHRRPHPAWPAGGEEAERPGQEPGEVGPPDRQRARGVEEHGGGVDDPPGGVDRDAPVGGEDARIAVRGPAPGRAAVDQGDLVSGLLQPEGGRDADHPRADHHHAPGARFRTHRTPIDRPLLRGS